MNTPGFLRYYDETLDLLLERGHEVVLGFISTTLRANALEALEGRPRRPQLIGEVPSRSDALAPMSVRLRNLVDFARYLHPRYAEAGFLRDRRRLRLLEARGLSGWLARRDTLPRPAVAALVRGLLLVERALPSAANIEAVLNEVRPDVVLVSPLVTSRSPQTDYVKSARALGIPSGLAVASWDNLTNKGLIRELPDRVPVWNDAQRDEAIRLHHVPRNRAFVERFIRPGGAEVPATPRLVAAIEQLAAPASAPTRPTWTLLWLGVLLRAGAALEARQAARRASGLDARLARGLRLVESLNRVSTRLAPRAPRTARRLRRASKRLHRTLRRRMQHRMRREKLQRTSEKRRLRERAVAIRSRYVE